MGTVRGSGTKSRKKKSPKKRDELRLKDYPCFKCETFRTRNCNPARCGKLKKYEKNTDVSPDTGNADWKTVVGAAKGMGVSDTSSFSLGYQETPLSREIEKRKVIEFDEFSELVDRSGVFKSYEGNLKKHYLEFFRCTEIATIAELAGQANRQNMHTFIQRRIKKMHKNLYPDKYNQMNIPPPKKYKEETVNLSL